MIPFRRRKVKHLSAWGKLWRRINRHYSETAASSEQCSSDCAPGVEVIPRQAFTAPAALVVSQATDHIQVCSSDMYTKFGARPLWFTCTATSWNMSAAELYVHLPSHCWSNHSTGQTFPGTLSDFRYHLSGTQTHSSDQ